MELFNILALVYFAVGAAVGFGLIMFIYIIRRNKVKQDLVENRRLADSIVDEARKETDTLKKTTILEAKDEWYKVQKKEEELLLERQKELRGLDKRYNDRLSNLDRRLDAMDKKEQNLSDWEQRNKQREDDIAAERKKVADLIEQQQAKLTQIAGLSSEQALEIIKNDLYDDARTQAAGEVKRIVNEARTNATREATGILSSAVQRIAVDYVSETTVSVVSLPSDEMKGRIIGREGRNIRTFEKASGTDLIIDDTPEAVVLSCFDPVRREIARISLEKLILDGRIHPGRIEEVIEKTRIEMDENMMRIGEQACIEMNLHNISPNIVKLLGRLQYRTSYGQNVLQHSLEAAWICGIMAAELGLKQDIARRAGFLHDIGKAIDHEFEGSHAALGANLARKNGESRLIVNAIEAHHEDVEPTSPYAVLVQAADAISGARPGARREMLETYMQRLEKLEEIANTVEGVNKSFAIQAGRELRIIVDPTSVDDARTSYIASDIAKKIEEEMQYPGQIKVVVIRETRQSAVAK
ncbi:MAG: ribonuclease Y [Candidatus Cloacimonetes bacterium]|nr:ribonuclease Y [Candidatus Cloacimonadota bacterium]